MGYKKLSKLVAELLGYLKKRIIPPPQLLKEIEENLY